MLTEQSSVIGNCQGLVKRIRNYETTERTEENSVFSKESFLIDMLILCVLCGVVLQY